MFSEIYFGFSIHILYLWGKREIKKTKVHVTLCSRSAAQFGESKSVLCTVLASDPGSVDVVMMSRFGSVEGEGAAFLCSFCCRLPVTVIGCG